MVTLGVAGCDGAAEADGTAATVPVATATRVRQLTEAETAGPLFRPDHVSRVGDALWILDAGNFRIVIRTPDSVYAVGREGDGPGEFRLPLSLSPNVTTADPLVESCEVLSTRRTSGGPLSTRQHLGRWHPHRRPLGRRARSRDRIRSFDSKRKHVEDSSHERLRNAQTRR